MKYVAVYETSFREWALLTPKWKDFFSKKIGKRKSN